MTRQGSLPPLSDYEPTAVYMGMLVPNIALCQEVEPAELFG